MASFDQFITSLRQEFGEQDAGKKFEVFCKWFLENDPQWSKEIDKVWSLAEFIAVSRPGHNLELPEAPEGTISVLEVPALSISSTNIRSRAEEGKPIWYLVPDGVVQYIAKHQLYRGGT